MSLLVAVTLTSAQRAKAQDAPTGYPKPSDPPIAGHEWKFTYNHASRSGEIEVAIGQWQRYYRTFTPSAEFTYEAPCQKSPTKKSPEAVSCMLDIQGAIKAAYKALGRKGNVADRELYDDITAYATGSWKDNANNSAVLAAHPSLKFSVERDGNGMRFSNSWTIPPTKGEKSALFHVAAGAEATVINTAIWQFEEWPQDYSYNKYDSSLAPNLGTELLKASPGPRFSFRLAPEIITIAPPANYDLSRFVVDPKFGQGG